MKTNYLQAMGIVTWRLRAPPAPPTDIYCYRLSDAQTPCYGMILAKISTPPERELFQAILQALAMQADPCTWTPAQRYILLGPACPAEYPLQNPLTTHSLAEMLHNPLLKAKVWQDFQLFLRQQ